MISWDKKPTQKILQPELLGQPNIPKSLHGINPRTIMGYSKWSMLRTNVINNHAYCAACGVEQAQYDLHEDYDFDYNKLELRIKQYIPLCKLCHNFIHSGRLTSLLAQNNISKEEVVTIIKHGFSITKNKIPVFIVMYELAKEVGVSTEGQRSWAPKNVSTGVWHLIYNNQKYKGMTLDEWSKIYNNFSSN